MSLEGREKRVERVLARVEATHLNDSLVMKHP